MIDVGIAGDEDDVDLVPAAASISARVIGKGGVGRAGNGRAAFSPVAGESITGN